MIQPDPAVFPRCGLRGGCFDPVAVLHVVWRELLQVMVESTWWSDGNVFHDGKLTKTGGRASETVN